MLQQSPTCYVCPACGRAVEVLVPVGEAPRCAHCDRLMKPPLRLALGGRAGRAAEAPGGRSSAATEAQVNRATAAPPTPRATKPSRIDPPYQLGLFGSEN